MSRLLTTVLGGFALLGVVTAVACGGDDKKIDLGNGNEGTISDDLPDDFPDDFPIYDGADLQGSVQGESSGIEGFVVTWKTGDDLEDVRAFYDEELSDGPWTSTSSGDLGGTSAFWQAENEDGSKVAYVNASTGDGDDTIILVTIGDEDDATFGGGDGGDDDATADDADDGGSDDDGDTSGDDDTDQPAAELPDEVDLSDDFPSDRVPLPDDARVTSSSSFSSGDTTTFLVELYSEDDVAALVDFFSSELEGNGWTESFQTETDGEAFLTFTPDNGADASTEAVTIAISPSDVEGYSDVVLSVSAGGE